DPDAREVQDADRGGVGHGGRDRRHRHHAERAQPDRNDRRPPLHRRPPGDPWYSHRPLVSTTLRRFGGKSTRTRRTASLRSVTERVFCQRSYERFGVGKRRRLAIPLVLERAPCLSSERGLSSMAMAPKPFPFVAIEGLDGSGKTRARRWIFERLERRRLEPLAIVQNGWLDVAATRTITAARYFDELPADFDALAA